MGESPCKQLVEDHPQRVDVRPNVEVIEIGREMLGAHVGGSAGGQERRRRLTGGAGLDRHGDAEVDQPRQPGVIDEDVARLEITVHHAAAVCMADRLAHPDEGRDDLAGAAAGGPGSDRAASLDQLHRKPGRPSGEVGHSGPEHLSNAGMPQPAEHLGLELRPAGDGCNQLPAGDYLQRDLAARALLGGLVDMPAAAPAEQPAERVTAESRARRERLHGGRPQAAGSRIKTVQGILDGGVVRTGLKGGACHAVVASAKKPTISKLAAE